MVTTKREGTSIYWMSPTGQTVHEFDYEELEVSKAYHRFPFDLSVARDQKEFPLKGDAVLVPTIEGEAHMQLNNEDNDLIDLRQVRKFESPFIRFYLSNPAQAGKSLEIYVGGEAGFTGYLFSQQSQLLNVAQEQINPATEDTLIDIYGTELDQKLLQMDIKSLNRMAVSDFYQVGRVQLGQNYSDYALGIMGNVLTVVKKVDDSWSIKLSDDANDVIKASDLREGAQIGVKFSEVYFSDDGTGQTSREAVFFASGKE